MKIKCKKLLWQYSRNKFRWIIQFSSCLALASPMVIQAAPPNVSIDKKMQQNITGTVSDRTGPIPGVSIRIKGTNVGTSTDEKGKFSLKAKTGDILVFSAVGYTPKEITITSSVINITLTEDIANLNEVVVVGYTTRKRGELTGSVSTLSAEEIQNTGNKDVAKSLAGKVSGLIVSDRGGYPGSSDDITLLIRGKATLGNNSPLILIDGITAGQGEFSKLSPQDIESLSVLKDGAAAIYGTRAANGVILVTTKRGKSGKPTVSLNSSYSISKFSVSPKLMTSSQFAIYENEIAARNAAPLPYTQEEINKFASGTDLLNFPNTNWYDLTFADAAPETRTSLSISGGNDKARYFISGDLNDRMGMFASKDLKFNQKQIRTNLDVNVFKNLKIGADLFGRFGKTAEPGVEAGYIYKHIYTNEPTLVGLYPNGLPSGVGLENGANPYVMASDQSGFVNRFDREFRSRFSYDLDLNTLIKGLSVNGYLGIRSLNNDEKSWYTPWTVYNYDQTTDKYSPSTGFSQRGSKRILRESFWKFNETLVNSTIRYNTLLNDVHSISGFVGFEQQTSNTRNFFAEKKDFPTAQHSELFAGSDAGQLSNGSSAEAATLSYFGSVSYDYNKKYFVDFTLRRDGSSNFGPGKRFGTFPGVAVAWALNRENFLDDVKWLDALKLRASYAVMGNDRIAPFQYLTRYNYGSQNVDTDRPNYYVFGLNGTSYNGYTSANVPNPDVTWETAYMQNLGLNFTVLNNRLSGDINYFYQKRTDILVTRAAAIPDAAGLTLPAENLGKVDNYGLELEMSWQDKVGSVNYNLGFNFTNAKNKVKYLAEAVNTPEGLRREGKPLDSYVVYPTAGIFRDQAQVDAAKAKLAGTVEGEPIYLDTNNDGKINSADRIRKFTSNVPEVQYGITGGLTYKNLSLNFLFQGQAKAEMLVFFDQKGAKPDYVFNDRWTVDNRNASFPRAFKQDDKYSGNQSGNVNRYEGADFWLKDASFLRLKEVEIGYFFSREKIKFGDVRVFVRGFNLLTMFSDVYKLGLDPEANGYNNFRNSTYPSLKSYAIGVNFNF